MKENDSTMNNSRSVRSVLPEAASIAIGIIPVLVMILVYDVPRKLIVGWGVLSYVLGVTIFKLPVYHLLVVRVLHRRLSPLPLSITHGLISSLSELGAAALFFLFVLPPLTIVQVVGFGIAAGAVEAIILPFLSNPLAGTPLENKEKHLQNAYSARGMIAWMGVLERALVMAPHAAARTLVYLAIATSDPLPALIAVITFASLDGVGYYGLLQGNSFESPKKLFAFYGFIAVIGCIQVVLCMIVYNQSGI